MFIFHTNLAQETVRYEGIDGFNGSAKLLCPIQPMLVRKPKMKSLNVLFIKGDVEPGEGYWFSIFWCPILLHLIKFNGNNDVIRCLFFSLVKIMYSQHVSHN